MVKKIILKHEVPRKFFQNISLFKAMEIEVAAMATEEANATKVVREVATTSVVATTEAMALAAMATDRMVSAKRVAASVRREDSMAVITGASKESSVAKGKRNYCISSGDVFVYHTHKWRC